MDLKVYEDAAMIADALPDEMREPFAALLDSLTDPALPDRVRISRGNGARKWIRDAGYRNG